jgi:hypothetical protein
MFSKWVTEGACGGRCVNSVIVSMFQKLKSIPADATAQGRVWGNERARRIVAALVFVGASVAVSAAIPPSAYNAVVWLSTILGRILPSCLLLLLCVVRQDSIGICWSGLFACMYVNSDENVAVGHQLSVAHC